MAKRDPSSREPSRAAGRPRTFSDADLLGVARRCFLEHGPGVSTSLIAEELGVSQAALFKRCKTKHELMIRALTPQSVPAWILKAVQGPDDRPVPEQLRELAGDLDEFLTQLMPCLSVLSSSGLRPGEVFAHHDVPPPVVAHRTLVAWSEKLEQRGEIRSGSTAGLATAFLGCLQGRQMMRYALGDRAPGGGVDYLDELVDIFWRGISSGRDD